MTIKIGDVVTVRPALGTGAPVKVTVIGLGHEQNNRPVFDYRDEFGDGRWAYMTQIVDD